MTTRANLSLGPTPVVGKPVWKLQPGRAYKRYEVRAVLSEDQIFVWRTYVSGRGWVYDVETFYAWELWQTGNGDSPPLLAHSVAAARGYRQRWVQIDRRRA